MEASRKAEAELQFQQADLRSRNGALQRELKRQQGAMAAARDVTRCVSVGTAGNGMRVLVGCRVSYLSSGCPTSCLQ